MSDTTRRGDARRRVGLLAALIATLLIGVWTAGAPTHPADAATAAPTAVTADIPVIDGHVGALPGPGMAAAGAERLGVTADTADIVVITDTAQFAGTGDTADAADTGTTARLLDGIARLLRVRLVGAPR